MYEYNRFVSLAELPGAAPDDSAVFVEGTVRQLPGTAIKIPGRKPFFYPRDERIEAVRAALSSPFDGFADENIGLRTVRDLLFRPQRVYPIKADIGRLAFALVGVVLEHPTSEPIALRIDIKAGLDELEVAVTQAVTEEIEGFLEELFVDTEPAHRVVLPGPKKAMRLAWIGGSHEEGLTPADWIDQVAAVAAVRGYRLTPFSKPYMNFSNVREAVHDLDPDAVVVWEVYAGSATGWADLKVPRPDNVVWITTDASGFGLALAQVTEQLDAAIVAGALENVGRDPDVDRPKAGDSRIYKKLHATPGHDVLVETDDCSHNAWESAHKAPKAEKGIERLVPELQIKSLQKCVACTGGGRWKATFE